MFGWDSVVRWRWIGRWKYQKNLHLDVIKVGPIPVEDGIGKEVVVVYKTEIQSNETFSTDSNGRQLIKRRRGERWEKIAVQILPRLSFDIDPTEPVAQNFYPVTSMIKIRCLLVTHIQ